MENVTNLSDKTKNSKHWSAVQALEQAMHDHMTDGPMEDAKKVLILSLTEIDGQYKVNFTQAGMKMSECVALTEVSKSMILEHMGY